MSDERVSAETMSKALNWRYATKGFDSSRRVADEDVKTILDSIRLAPTSFGLQPFRVIVVTDPAIKAQLRPAAYGQPQIEQSSHLLVFVANGDLKQRTERFINHLKANHVPAEKVETLSKQIKITDFFRGLTFSRGSYAAQQAHIALGFALFTAAQLRVDACPMGGFEPGKFAKILGISSPEKPVVLLGLGYRSADDRVSPKYRLPIEDLVSFK